ncbi:MAG: carbohydrate ABC transporter permease [Bacilli bacterium]|nr:carbohydrate ABC transporter permease [Bacilli bacterium]MBO6280622.1 carbohydrate ABC transporter permease [Bacilli bacterium]
MLKPRFNDIPRRRLLTPRSIKGRALFAAVFVLFFIYALSLLAPFLFLFVNSLKTPTEYLADSIDGNIFNFPQGWRFSNWVEVFSEMKIIDSKGDYVYFPTMLLNSLWYSMVLTLGGLLASSLTAYCLAKYKFKLRGFLYGIAIVTMTIPIIGSTGAMFKLTYDIGIYNTPLYPILTSLGGFGFNFLVLYGFFKNISWNYAEAVFVDGGGHFTAFFKIMLPQIFPALLTLGIIAFIGAWNDYTTPLLFLPDYPTIASGIYNVQVHLKRTGDYPQYFAALGISIIPIIILFATFSDSLMKNLSVGGLKG